MAVAFGSSVNVTPATGSSATSPSLTTPATNPVVIVAVALASATATVSSMSTTFGGTPAEIKNQRGSVATDSFVSIWAIPSPTANTAGTVTVNLSASVPYQMDFLGYSGADQTTPCASGDAVAKDEAVASDTLTPLNLTANDATVGANGNTQLQDCAAPTPNNRYLGNSTAINLAVGDNTGITGVTLGTANPGGFDAVYVAVRIKAASAAAKPYPPFQLKAA